MEKCLCDIDAAMTTMLPSHSKVLVHYSSVNVDIAPSLALLFGVPIPKNNVGMLLGAALKPLTGITDDQLLRLLELNSWQLLRLLHAQFPDLVYEKVSCAASCKENFVSSDRLQMLCCLYLEAASLHGSWKTQRGFRSMSADDHSSVIAAYHKFLRVASECLSRRATDKPFGLLACGVAAMFLSSMIFLALLFSLFEENLVGEKGSFFCANASLRGWYFDEIFNLFMVTMVVISMGSSSMIEEEQYIWHFFTVSFHLVVLRKLVQTFTSQPMQNMNNISTASKRRHLQIYLIIVVLASGRFLRGWHQGGVNWVYLPDIAKWLAQAGNAYIKMLQLVSAILIISRHLLSVVWLKWSSRKYATLAVLIHSFPGLLVLLYITKYQDVAFTESNYAATSFTQIIYATLIIYVAGTVLFAPWVMLPRNSSFLSNDPSEFQKTFLILVRGASYVVGSIYIYCWCLLQLVLQQPVNTAAFLLILIQILGSIWCFANSGHLFREWVEVSALYYVGMAGHFGLGNTNTLATIDVAGAFIGVSNHSTLLSGILMFVITYASPVLSMLSMVVYIAMKDTVVRKSQEHAFGHLVKMLIGFPCLVPLGLNSILLIAYTIVLLLMRNHLFVWSVFSPKYLYVCATTASLCFSATIVALTVAYISMVVFRHVQDQQFKKDMSSH